MAVPLDPVALLCFLRARGFATHYCHRFRAQNLRGGQGRVEGSVCQDVDHGDQQARDADGARKVP